MPVLYIIRMKYSSMHKTYLHNETRVKIWRMLWKNSVTRGEESHVCLKAAAEGFFLPIPETGYSFT